MIYQQQKIWRSLAGGEVSDELYGRADLVKNQTGLKRCYNFAITPQGTAEKRSGSRYIANAKLSDARLETFIREDGFGFLIETGDQYMRVYGSGTFIQEIATPYLGQDSRNISVAQFVNDMSICHRDYAPRVLRRVNDSTWTLFQPVFNATLSETGSLTVTANQTTATTSDPQVEYLYRVSTLDVNGTESSVSAGYAVFNILRVAGNNNSLAWTAVPNAFRYNVYASRGNGTMGFIGSADAVPSPSFVDDNITPDGLTRPPDPIVSFTGTGNYPGLVAFHEQRALFANTYNDPQSFWASGLAGFEYFKASEPPQKDQAFTYQLSSKKAAPIRHMVALRDVLMFTESGVFRVYTPTGEPFAPDTISAIPVSAYGASAHVRPQEASNAVLFPAARGDHLISLRYDAAGEGYIGEDLSLVAAHLIDGFARTGSPTWSQTGLQRSPYQIWWGLRNDGKLIGMTYVAEQQVYAWFQYEIPNATISSFAIVPEGTNDKIYVIVQRALVIDGVLQIKAYIERLEPRFTNRTDMSDAFFVDSGVTYDGFPTTTFGGLDHLKDQVVTVLGDGQPMGTFTVDDFGRIELPEPKGTVQIGLSYSAELEFLPITSELQALGIQQNPSALLLRLKRSEGIEAGPSFDSLRPMQPPPTDLIGDTMTLRDGVHAIDLDPQWSLDGSIVLRQSVPLPAAITGVALDFAGAE